MSKNQRSLKNLWIVPKFQTKFLALLLLGAFSQVVIFGLVTSYFLRENYAILIQYADLEPEIRAILQGELRTIIVTLVSCSALLLVGIALLGLFFSHRVAGMLYAMKRTIVSITAGKNVKLTVRPTDEFKDVADAFNDMVTALQNKNNNHRKAN